MKKDKTLDKQPWNAFRAFNEARQFVHSLRLVSKTQWMAYSTSGAKPVDIPSNPDVAYKADWVGYRDWLG